MNGRSALDLDDDVDGAPLHVEVGLRYHLDQREAAVAVVPRDVEQVLRDDAAAEPVARARVDHLAELASPAERLDLVAVGVDLRDAKPSDAEARAFLDRDGDVDALAIGRELDARCADRDREVSAVVVDRLDASVVLLEVLAG